jgi:hypothetical protein
MYISSTNIYINPSENISNIPNSLITSERYYNCENFFTSTHHKKKGLFLKLIGK